MSPLVSVIIPTQNRPALLREALKSVKEQTFRPVEIVVVNDGGQSVQSFVQGQPGDLQVVYQEHARSLGVAACRNTAIRACQGEFIAYLDDDDVYYPPHLETLVEGLVRENAAVAYTDAYRSVLEKRGHQYFEKEKQLCYSHDPRNMDDLYVGNRIPILCLMHRRSCLESAGMFDETLETQEDWDFIIRLANRFPFVHIPKITAEYRWRGEGTSLSTTKRQSFAASTKTIYDRYRQHVEQKPHILQAQADHLRVLRTDHESLMDVHGFIARITALVEAGSVREALEDYQAHRAQLISTPVLDQFDSVMVQLKKAIHPM